MKLIRFYIVRYQILHNLDLRFTFDATSDITSGTTLTFLVGVNGTGKSTVLRALTDLLLQLNNPTITTAEGWLAHGFTLEYTFQGKQIKVTNFATDDEITSPLGQIRMIVD